MNDEAVAAAVEAAGAGGSSLERRVLETYRDKGAWHLAFVAPPCAAKEK